jgi:hypothetical protein
MTRSRKLGIASAVLLGSIFLPPFANWRQPISFASVGVSAALGLLAAQQGNKWWLIIPASLWLGLLWVYILRRIHFDSKRPTTNIPNRFPGIAILLRLVSANLRRKR